jgi:hypothetical protein
MCRALPILCLLACGSAGCASAVLAYAPRLPGPERPPRPVAELRLIDLGKPDCNYEVIGTVFADSKQNLVEAAAAHGGDGVYDSSCEARLVSHVYFSTARVRCDGRVYVCTSKSKSKGKAPPAAGETD